MVAGVLSGCNSPAKIEWEPKSPVITAKDQVIALKVTVKDSSDRKLPDAKVEYISLTPPILKVDGTGRVTPVRSGDGQVLLRAGSLTKAVDISVQLPSKVEIIPDNPVINVGVTKGFKARILNDQGKTMLAAGKMRWASSDPSVATVDAFGNVKTLKDGKTTITVHAAGITGKTLLTVSHERLSDDNSAWVHPDPDDVKAKKDKKK